MPVPSPRPPPPRRPQQRTVRSISTAQSLALPAPIATALVKHGTLPGMDPNISSLPELAIIGHSCPLPASTVIGLVSSWIPAGAWPQHSTVPSSSNAQVWIFPAESALTPHRCETGSGLALYERQPRPTPSWPNRLSPQHFTVPPAKSAQVW